MQIDVNLVVPAEMSPFTEEVGEKGREKLVSLVNAIAAAVEVAIGVWNANETYKDRKPVPEGKRPKMKSFQYRFPPEKDASPFPIPFLMEYQEFVESVESLPPGLKGMDLLRSRMVHGVLGVGTEQGEIADQIKRHIYYGTDVDVDNVKEEIGDLVWYLTLLCNVFDLTLQDVIESNRRKLQARYPKGKFDGGDATSRDLDKEREALSTQGENLGDPLTKRSPEEKTKIGPEFSGFVDYADIDGEP